MNSDVIYGGGEFYALGNQQDIFNVWKSIQKKPDAVKSSVLPFKSGQVFDLDRRRLSH